MKENNNIATIHSSPSLLCSLTQKRPPTIHIPTNVLSEIQEPFFSNIATDCFFGYGVALFCRKGKKTFMEDTHKIISTSHYKRVVGSGSCYVTALIEGKEIIISNLGDCRAVLCRNEVTEALTRDHRAKREDERKRIDDKVALLEFKKRLKIHLLSLLIVIGDGHLKDWVPAEPDTKTLILAPDMEYLVLASDGLWDQVGNQEAIDLIMQSCLREKSMQVATSNEKEEDKIDCSSLGSFSCIYIPQSLALTVIQVRCRIEKIDDSLNL
ncbi:hypothetical protein RDI58_010578 [Solanum bulbocastanum]|uniref:PPM-type phosphatase domain-containing protein n=1 Tax=Solanum bulbocastanum TaxID=147425 RepID=A0AAN8TUN9_SOLBU